MPVVGLGPVRGVSVTMVPAGSMTIETTGGSSQLAQGWALLSSQSTSDTVGGFATFTRRVQGLPDLQAVVPIVNQFDSHFVMIFDNASAVTAAAFANPTLSNVSVPVVIRNEAGVVIDRRTMAFGPYGHMAFALPDVWGSTAGRRGTIEFLTSGFGIGALGLRFTGLSFSSFHVLTNFDWLK